MNHHLRVVFHSLCASCQAGSESGKFSLEIFQKSNDSHFVLFAHQFVVLILVMVMVVVVGMGKDQR